MMMNVKYRKLFKNMLAAARILLGYRCRGHCKFLFVFFIIIVIDVVVVVVGLSLLMPI